MSEPLLPAESAQFSAIIDSILASGNLETISAKQIRKALSAQLGVNLDDKKQAVQELILERFDRAQNRPDEPEPPATNGHAKSESAKTKPTPSNSPSISTPVSKEESEEEIERPKKKVKRAKPIDDAALAARLQAQENGRARPTRGAAPKKKALPRKKQPKKKSAAKVKAEDDSELELDSNGEVKEKPKKGGFHKEYMLSTPLADLVDAPKLSRPQVVKKIWVYIKAHNLQDPNDKRQIMCDEKLQLVFKTDKVHMFTMNKLLGKQLYPIEEEDAAT